MYLFLPFANLSCLLGFLSLKDRSYKRVGGYFEHLFQKIYARISFAHQELELGAPLFKPGSRALHQNVPWWV